MGLLIAAVTIFIAGLVLESTTSWVAIRVAKKRHAILWTHSGKPTLLENGDLMKAWPLVKYYRDRTYLRQVQYEEGHLPPITEANSLAFAEKLRLPLLYSYYAGWGGVVISIFLFLAAGFF